MMKAIDNVIYISHNTEEYHTDVGTLSSEIKVLSKFIRLSFNVRFIPQVNVQNWCF